VCVAVQGETAASHDVTSNVERSKHLDDELQAKIYKAEVSEDTEAQGLLHRDRVTLISSCYSTQQSVHDVHASCSTKTRSLNAVVQDNLHACFTTATPADLLCCLAGLHFPS